MILRIIVILNQKRPRDAETSGTMDYYYVGVIIMSDSTKAHVCLQEIVKLFKSGEIPKALAVAVIPPQAGIPSAWRPEIAAGS